MTEGKTMRVQHPLAEGAEIRESELWDFSDGIIGLSELRRFALVPIRGAEPFRLLASVESPGFGVVVTNPSLFVPDYRLELTHEDVLPLGLADSEEAEILVTVVLPRGNEPMRLNLRGPILLCARTRRGIQRVSRNESHGSRALPERGSSTRAPSPAPCSS
jgi:flagellar assembly factor FliW